MTTIKLTDLTRRLLTTIKDKTIAIINRFSINLSLISCINDTDDGADDD